MVTELTRAQKIEACLKEMGYHDVEIIEDDDLGPGTIRNAGKLVPPVVWRRAFRVCRFPYPAIWDDFEDDLPDVPRETVSL